MDAVKIAKLLAILMVDALLVKAAGSGTPQTFDASPSARAISVMYHKTKDGVVEEHDFCPAYFGKKEGMDKFSCAACGFTVDTEDRGEDGVERLEKKIADILDAQEEKGEEERQQREQNPTFLGILFDLLLDKEENHAAEAPD